MKRIFLAASLMMFMVSCSKNSVVEDIPNEPINFSNVFVDNSTKAATDGSYTTATLSQFEVYGTITNSNNQSANIFNKELVTKSESNVWSYSANNTQYWIPGNTYNFTAIAEGNVTGENDAKVTEVLANNGTNMPTAIKLYDASLQKDILYAKSEEIQYTGGPKTVEFTFNHLMSKAKFTVKNAITTNNGYSYKVKDIKITNAAKISTYTIESGWNGSSNDVYTLDFGNIVNTSAEAVEINYNQSYESNFERLLIPTDNVQDKKTDIRISFTCELYKNNVLVQTTTKDYTAQVKLEPAHSYNFRIELGNPGEPINFRVYSVNGWSTPATEVTINQ